jgi:hypothetical protein
MIDASIVAAETLKDEEVKVEEPKKDEATTSDNEDKKDTEEPAEKIKAVVTEDGGLFLKMESGASSLAASAMAIMALCSIIY